MWHRTAIVVVALLLFASPRVALACSCVQSTRPQLVGNAVVIFAGVVTAQHGSFLPLVTCRMSSADPVAFEFSVDQIYKGDVSRTVSVSTVVSGASCGYEFQVGKRYTVFATGTGDKLETDLCRGNVEGDIAAAEYGLGPGRAPSR